MQKTILTPDICVIGAGSAGLTVAAAAAAFGVEVVLIEKDKMGGDCLNYGCVPSKALIAAGKAAQAHRNSAKYGVKANEPSIDFAAANAHVRNVIAAIEPHDSVERFEGLGVNVIQSAARFVDAETVEAGHYLIKARRFVVATGSSAFVPPIAGLNEVPYLTNETLFDQTNRPDHLLIIGGGPIGMEMAQAHQRLGSKVTVIEASKALSNSDPEFAAIVIDRLRAEGVDIREGANVEKAEKSENGVRLTLKQANGTIDYVDGTHLLVAAGRSANITNLGLDEAGIKTHSKGIEVDKGLRTSNKKVYAIGDVIGGLQFTHLAGAHASLLVRTLLFRMPVNHHKLVIPFVTYTEPELAHIGMTEQEARQVHGDGLKVLTADFSGNDRALAEGKTVGKVKLIVGKGGRLVGADIVGPQAGELLAPLALMISKKMHVKALLDLMLPYPTLTEVLKRAALSYYAGAAESPWLRRLLAFLRKLG
ncbi:dihydrolipoyl dehydrogenase family protein [Pseudovibrio sp. SPO723]|uniref:dihydrolipoyl dehydrogenase family protein n=1 Tax=Nesiotobacter zosterae TaxID=392721 RepID=UPI0029C588AE|nr:FAD-dependent oxidoreductase [Pseudovibrio sp. SPO723]MDX5592401.1 FAD-dependent oxidoreductase [Pseudovibrio sp. SPO723]